ncbi:gas vesicle protein GvpG [Kutzneria viridogrisea]|uniref:Gas vesicle protein G n=2 Tax=Kutzneria TaxID=43356 RepID=W5WHV4_9PSEU|nr:gas vesicle protein GvpG [Kutzneria albida]AHI00152.1 hypothetical protein KALB_6793 [Kutzneria albida DSM 43870]MBA8925328.1 hypothetical protein [Kutzneria viridogrisea]
MGLLSALVTLPLAPVRGVIWLAERLAEHAQAQLHDPQVIRGQLAELARARQRGEVSEQDGDRLEQELLDRLWSARPPGPEGL